MSTPGRIRYDLKLRDTWEGRVVSPGPRFADSPPVVGLKTADRPLPKTSKYLPILDSTIELPIMQLGANI